MYDSFQGVEFSIPALPELGGIEVCRWPGRKQVALGFVDGNIHSPIAYFRNESDAVRFIEWIQVATRARA